MFNDVEWCLMMFSDVEWCFMLFSDVWWCLMIFRDILSSFWPEIEHNHNQQYVLFSMATLKIDHESIKPKRLPHVLRHHLSWRQGRPPRHGWFIVGISHKIPSGKHTKSCWKLPFTVELPIKKLWFSIVVLVYRRVSHKGSLINHY